jgi:hypothetical protein
MAKKPSKRASSAARVPLAAHHVVAVLLVAALAADVRVAVVAEVQAEVQEAGAAKVAVAVDKSQPRRPKIACSFKGNPLKRLK